MVTWVRQPDKIINYPSQTKYITCHLELCVVLYTPTCLHIAVVCKDNDSNNVLSHFGLAVGCL